MTAVKLSQAAPHAPLDLSFTTSSLPLLGGISEAKSADVSIPVLTLSVRDPGRRPTDATPSRG